MPCTYGISVRIKRTEEQAGKRIRIGAKGSRLSFPTDRECVILDRRKTVPEIV